MAGLHVNRTENRLHVRGHLEIEDHMLPFAHRVEPGDHPSKLERKLDRLHEKGVAWIEAREQAKKTYRQGGLVGATEWAIEECDVQFHGPYDWRLWCKWRETRNGATQYHKRYWHYSHPAAVLPPNMMLLDVVEAVTRHENAARQMDAHEEAARALAQ